MKLKFYLFISLTFLFLLTDSKGFVSGIHEKFPDIQQFLFIIILLPKGILLPVT